MKTLTSLLSGALLCSNLLAQGVITRQYAGQSYFYYDGNIQNVLLDAFNSLETDTIILGGGIYPLSSAMVINTRVVMIGTGVHPDSSAAHINNGRTVISGNAVVLDPGATGSQIHGITFQNNANVSFGSGNTSTTNVDSVGFFRCQFLYVNLGDDNGAGVSYGSFANDTYFHECIFLNGLGVNAAINTVVRNCSMNNVFWMYGNGNNTLFENNLFFNWVPDYQGQYVPIGGATYRKNVFLRNSTTTVTCNEASSFQNNIYLGNGSSFDVAFGPNAVAVAGSNVITGTLNGPTGVFPASGPGQVTNYNAFSYYADYHLNTNAGVLPANVQDAGIFGGGDPWKPGSVPFNPHWRELETPSGTDSGVLQGVTIKGAAQQD